MSNELRSIIAGNNNKGRALWRTLNIHGKKLVMEKAPLYLFLDPECVTSSWEYKASSESFILHHHTISMDSYLDQSDFDPRSGRRISIKAVLGKVFQTLRLNIDGYASCSMFHMFVFIICIINDVDDGYEKAGYPSAFRQCSNKLREHFGSSILVYHNIRIQLIC